MDEQKDLPLPEKEISEHATPASQGETFQGYKKTNIFKSKFFLGFIGISFLVAFLVGGFALGKNSANKQVACTQEAKQCSDGSYVGREGPKCEFAACPSGDQTGNPNLSPGQPKVTEDPATADWKTYTDPENIYQLKYPTNWTTIDEDSYGNHIISFYPIGYSFKAPGEPAKDTPFLRITVLPEVIGRGVNPKKIEQIIIDGVSYKKFYESTTDGVIETISAPNGKGIMIHFKLPQNSEMESVDSTFNQILSTFKFTK